MNNKQHFDSLPGGTYLQLDGWDDKVYLKVATAEGHTRLLDLDTMTVHRPIEMFTYRLTESIQVLEKIPHRFINGWSPCTCEPKS